MNIKIHKGFWTRDQVARDTESVYVFGDNSEDAVSGYVPSTTQACVRMLPNVIGIITKVDRKWNKHSFFSDDYVEIYKILLEVAIQLIHIQIEKGKTIVFPEQGLGTGKAMLKEKAPACWDYLCKRLKEEFNYNNGQDN